MTKEAQTRNKEIDILKGIGICLVVGAHASMPFSREISLFHMALFFMASGFLFRDKYSDDLKGVSRFVVRRISALYLPFCIWNSIFVLLHNFFLKIHFYTDNNAFLQAEAGNAYGLNSYKSFNQIGLELKNIWLFSGESGFGGATWFLRGLFTVSLLFIIVDWLLKKILKEKIMAGRCIFAVLFLLLGNFLAGEGCVFPLNIHSCFSNYALLVLGMLLREMGKWIPEKFKNTVSWILFGIISLVILFVASPNGAVNTNSGEYTSIIFFVLVSLAGWGFVYSVASLIIKSKKAGYMFQYLGQHSIVILFTHFLSFKLVTLGEVMVLGLPSYMLASFPVLYTEHGLWLVYLLAGVGIPSLLYWCYAKLCNCCQVKKIICVVNEHLQVFEGCRERVKLIVSILLLACLFGGSIYWGNWNTGTLFLPDNQIIYVNGMSEDDMWVSDGAELRILNQSGNVLHIQGEYTNEINGSQSLIVKMNGIDCLEYTIVDNKIDIMLELESNDCQIAFSGNCKYPAPAPDTRMFLFMKNHIEIIQTNIQ